MSVKGLSIHKQTELENLARKIKASHQATCQMARKIRAQCNEAVAEAILCGQALIRAKAICEHGEWYAWLDRHCPKISKETVQRYMRLANPSHVTDLKDAKSLRHAYLLVGVISETEQITKKVVLGEVVETDITNTSETGQRNGNVFIESPPTFPLTPPRHTLAPTPNSMVEPVAQTTIHPSTSFHSAPVTILRPQQPNGAKHLHHLSTLVQDIAKILEEVTEAERPAVLDALQPICTWVNRKQ